MNHLSFTAQLKREVARIRAACAADGITAVSLDCLAANIRWESLPDMPRGTNALFVAKQTLRSLCASTNNFHRFVE